MKIDQNISYNAWVHRLDKSRQHVQDHKFANIFNIFTFILTQQYQRMHTKRYQRRSIEILTTKHFIVDWIALGRDQLLMNSYWMMLLLFGGLLIYPTIQPSHLYASLARLINARGRTQLRVCVLHVACTCKPLHEGLLCGAYCIRLFFFSYVICRRVLSTLSSSYKHRIGSPRHPVFRDVLVHLRWMELGWGKGPWQSAKHGGVFYNASIIITARITYSSLQYELGELRVN